MLKKEVEYPAVLKHLAGAIVRITDIYGDYVKVTESIDWAIPVDYIKTVLAIAEQKQLIKKNVLQKLTDTLNGDISCYWYGTDFYCMIKNLGIIYHYKDTINFCNMLSCSSIHIYNQIMADYLNTVFNILLKNCS